MKSPPKERAAVLGPPIKKLAAQYYHCQDAPQVCGHNKREDYGRLYRVLRVIQRPGWAYCWAIERLCSKIETKHELDKWNRENQERSDHERD
jgi:hypothetical protein